MIVSIIYSWYLLNSGNHSKPITEKNDLFLIANENND